MVTNNNGYLNSMNDISFVVNSYSIGLGASYKVADNVTLSAAYFQTNYSNYDTPAPTASSVLVFRLTSKFFPTTCVCITTHQPQQIAVKCRYTGRLAMVRLVL